MKKLLAFFLALALLASLCACGYEQEPDEPVTLAPAMAESTPAIAETPAPAAPALSDSAKGYAWSPDGTVTLLAPVLGSDDRDYAEALGEYMGKYMGYAVEVRTVEGSNIASSLSALSEAGADGLALCLVSVPELWGYWADGFEEQLRSVCTVYNDPLAVAVRADDERFGSLADLTGLDFTPVAAVSGSRSLSHAGIQLLTRSAGFSVRYAVRSSHDDALAYLLSGSAELCVVPVSAAEKAGGDVKILGVFSEERLADKALEDVPTLGEAGLYADRCASAGFLLAPAAVSDEIVAYYEDTLRIVVSDPDFTERTALRRGSFSDSEAASGLFASDVGLMQQLDEDFWK